MKSRGPVRTLIGAAIGLCLFGVYESVDAAIGVFRAPEGPFGELLQGSDSVEQFWDPFVTAAWLAWVVQLALAEWWVARRTPQVSAAREPAAV